MKNAKDYTGQQIGRLAVIKRATDKINCYGQPIVMWECVCKCGAVVYRRSYHLKRGNCSCNQCKAIEDAKRFGFNDIRQHHWHNIKKQADKRNLPFSLTMKYAWDLFERQERKCTLSGLPIHFAKTKKDHATGGTTASLDRIDSSLGYVEGNVQWLHKWVNLMKSDFEPDEFLSYCRLIVEHADQKKEITTARQDSRRKILYH